MSVAMMPAVLKLGGGMGGSGPWPPNDSWESSARAISKDYRSWDMTKKLKCTVCGADSMIGHLEDTKAKMAA